jgi:hypothetical protein
MFLLLSFLLCFTGYTTVEEKILTESSVDKIIGLEIKKLDVHILTEYAIEGKDFETSFNDHILTEIIEDRSKIDNFLMIINKGKEIFKGGNIDTRGKITVYYESGKKTIIYATSPVFMISIDEKFYEFDGIALSDFTKI